MFTLCLGYLIFAATMFRLQSNSLSETLEWTSGADISIASPSLSLPLPEDELRTYLMAQRVNSDAITTDPQIVVDYTFTSFAINEFFPVLWAEIERPVNIKSISVKIYAVERNFLSVVLDRYCMTTELDHAVKFRPLPNGSPNVVAALYRNTAVADPGVGNILAIPATDPEAIALSVEGAVNFYREPMPVLVSEAARDRAFISTQNEAILEVGLRTDGVTSVTQTWLVQPIAMLKKFPAFMAVNRLVTKDTPLFVSMDWYGRILDSIEERANTTMNEFNGQELPKSQLFVRVTPGATALEIEALLNRINSILANDKFTATDLRSLVATTRTASDFIDVAFGIVAFVGIVLSFFVLLLSFIANIRENSWELGVLRAVGLSVWRGASVVCIVAISDARDYIQVNAVSRVYIYEALSIIFACVIVGTTLGRR